MSEYINTLAQREDAISKIFTGETQQNALNFVRYLDSLGMTAAGNEIGGRFYYKGKKVCDIHILNIDDEFGGYPDPWTVWMGRHILLGSENIWVDECFKEIVWAHAHQCENCFSGRSAADGTWCRGDKRVTIFDRDFDNLCLNPIAFTDPNAEEVECMKKLVEMKKLAIDNG